MNNLNSIGISLEMFHSMFDADGNISAQFDVKERKNGNFYVNVSWIWEFSQSSMNELNTTAIANLLNLQVRKKRRLTGREAGKVEASVKGTMLSESGQVILSMYRATPPRSWTRLRQFVAYDYCLTNLYAGSTTDKTNIIRELYIAKHISSALRQPVEPIIQKLNLAEDFVRSAQNLAEQDIALIDNQIQNIWNNVPNQNFTNDNIRGAFVADGSIGVAYCFRTQSNTLSFRPTFSIANIDRQPLYAIQHTFGGAGHVNRAGTGNQYVLTGIRAFREILYPIFDGIRLPSAYKQQQWDKTIEVVRMLERKEHKNFEGFCRIIDLSYDISHVNKRKHSKEHYKNVDFLPKA